MVGVMIGEKRVGMVIVNGFGVRLVVRFGLSLD
jgi:hypothetical protein